MQKFVVQPGRLAEQTWHNTLRDAKQAAFNIAKKSGESCSVYENVCTIFLTCEALACQPEPLKVDIDKLIALAATIGGRNSSYLLGAILQQLKKDGATELEMPEGFKL